MTHDAITLKSIPDIALAAPFMLGYWPDSSVCVIVIDADGGVLLIMRWHIDAPDVPPQIPLADASAAHAFHVVVYPTSGVDAVPDLGQQGPWTRVIDEIAARGIPLGHLVLASQDPSGVVAVTGGAATGVSTTMHLDKELIAEIGGRWDLVGWVGSRAEYVADIAPDPCLVEEVAAALRDAEPIDEQRRDAAIDTVLESLIAADVTPQSIAGIIVGLADIRVRDTVLWELMHAHVDVWSEAADSLAEVVSGSPEDHVAAPATLLAILRWQQGDGSRAAAAVERAITADPTYSLADLINRCLLVGLHPNTWVESLVGLTRDACRRAA